MVVNLVYPETLARAERHGDLLTEAADTLIPSSAQHDGVIRTHFHELPAEFPLPAISDIEDMCKGLIAAAGSSLDSSNVL